MEEYGTFPKSSKQRDLLLVSAKKKRKSYTSIFTIKFYCGGEYEYLFYRISVTMKKNPGKKL